MTEVTVSQAEEYLSVLGASTTPQVTDEEVLKVLGTAYRLGLITGFDWDTNLGRIVCQQIGGVWAEYQDWLKANDINPDTFGWPEGDANSDAGPA